MKTNEMVRILKKDGWVLDRHGGDHDVYKHPTKKGMVIVPRHGSAELRKGTEKSILKQAGLK